MFAVVAAIPIVRIGRVVTDRRKNVYGDFSKFNSWRLCKYTAIDSGDLT
jgi:hypothetical protein